MALSTIFNLIAKTDLDLDATINDFECEVYNHFNTFLTSDDMETLTSPYLITAKGSARDVLNEKFVTARIGEIKETDLKDYLEE